MRFLWQNDYAHLLRHNRVYRRLWYGQVVSLLGDWFDSIALYTLVYRLTGSGQSVAGIIVAQLLPAAFAAPLAGMVVDRVPRKAVMIASDLARAALVLAFLAVRSASDVWMVYPIMALKVAVSTCFEPARAAIIPLVVTRERLVVANTVGGITWSAMLSIGAALGGLVTSLTGPYTAIVLDSLSFVVSAGFIAMAGLPYSAPSAGSRRNAWHEFTDGLRFIGNHSRVLLYATIKTAWGVSGGTLLILPIFAIWKDRSRERH